MHLTKEFSQKWISTWDATMSRLNYSSPEGPFFDLGSVNGAKGQTHATKACLGAIRNKVPLN